MWGCWNRCTIGSKPSNKKWWLSESSTKFVVYSTWPHKCYSRLGRTSSCNGKKSHIYSSAHNETSLRKLRSDLAEIGDGVKVVALALIQPLVWWPPLSNTGWHWLVRGMNDHPPESFVLQPTELLDSLTTFLSSLPAEWNPDKIGWCYAALCHHSTLIREDLHSVKSDLLCPLLVVNSKVVSKEAWSKQKQQKGSYIEKKSETREWYLCIPITPSLRSLYSLCQKKCSHLLLAVAPFDVVLWYGPCLWFKKRSSNFHTCWQIHNLVASTDTILWLQQTHLNLFLERFHKFCCVCRKEGSASWSAFKNKRPHAKRNNKWWGRQRMFFFFFFAPT